jgi:hypothetical protein
VVQIVHPADSAGIAVSALPSALKAPLKDWQQIKRILNIELTLNFVLAVDSAKAHAPAEYGILSPTHPCKSYLIIIRNINDTGQKFILPGVSYF